MLRVLMVLEDYGELMFLQTVLKKIGFDVDAIQNPRQFQDTCLAMNPDVLVMTGYGKRVRGLEMSRAVRKVRGLPRIILIRGGSLTREEDLAVDAWLDTPVGAMPLLNAIAETCGLDREMLADKFTKLRLQGAVPEEARVLKTDELSSEAKEMKRGPATSGNFETLAQSSLTADERRERYQKFLKSNVPIQTGFSVKQVQDQIKELRRSENPDDLAELERQRKAFVEELFKKK